MASALFSSLRLADLTLDNRIVISPMCQYSADDGVANDWHVSHLGMLANSGAGLLIIEATHVERPGRITHGCLGLYSDHCESALLRVIDHCHRIGTAKIGIQLAHAGRKASAQRPWEGGASLASGADRWDTIGPSAIPIHLCRLADTRGRSSTGSGVWSRRVASRSPRKSAQASKSSSDRSRRSRRCVRRPTLKP